jgi:OOP family OmpA-OmpF porin
MAYFRLVVISLWAIASIVFSATAGAQASRDPWFEQLSAAIEKARAEQVDSLAPRGFAAAVEALETATRDAERGRNPDRIRARLTEGMNAIDSATRATEAARGLYSSVIKAWSDALTAEAPKLAGEAWQRAAQRFTDAMAANERNDMRTAQRRAAEAEVLLRDVELTAIKASVLNEARGLIAQAEQSKVEKVAPRTLQAARRYLAEAEREIQLNRYDLASPKNLAAQARYEARHALHLAQVIKQVLEQEDRGQAGLEQLILSWEEPLKRIAAEMELSPRFDEGFQRAMQELLEHTQQQHQVTRRLTLELEDKNQQIASLKSENQRLEARLGGVSEERIALQRRLDAQERLRANVAAVAASFTPDEARVFRQGEDVVISLLGIKFASGRSSLDAANTALMHKVREALALFPGASIVVEGHTDANGSDSANLILSQDRADAVKQYLVSNFQIDPERITSIGYGEARPVATNETAEGRARNRRIDLVVRVAN